MRVSCTRDSSHPHAVTSTSNGYSAAYDASGNMICRATTTATTCSGSSPTGQQLSYDAEGRLSLWQNQPTSPTQTVNSLYDGSGNRVAMQSTVSGTTTLTSYIGSIEEVQSNGSSTQTTTYYAIEGKRIAADVNGTFYYFGYDALGSQVAVLDAAGHLVGAQLYSPYGNSRYNNGTLPTSIGFTGQRADSVTGLDYYVARYYDPAVGQFLSADSVQGNAVGMDPYAYVGGNPETRTDPTGNFFYNPGTGEGARFVSGSRTPVTFYYTEPVRTTYSLQPTYVRPRPTTPVNTNPFQRVWGWVTHQVNRVQDHFTLNSAFRQPTDVCQLASFQASTLVATSKGSKPIITLRVGEKVWAYNPKTHKKELQPIVHLWVRHDNDLVDLTIKSTVSTRHGTSKQEKSEVIHTTQKHPFLTKEKGFVTARKLTIDMHVLDINGSIGTIVGWKVIPGSMDMYNLEIAQDHTFTVGDGQWVVHNCGGYDDTGDLNLKGASFRDIVARLPKSVRDNVEINTQPDENGVYGVRWKWKSGNEEWDVHLHSADPNAPPGSSSATGWIVRVIRKPWGASGLKKSSSMDDQGNWVKYKDATKAQKDDSHIPIEDQTTDPTSPFFSGDGPIEPINPSDPTLGPDDPLFGG